MRFALATLLVLAAAGPLKGEPLRIGVAAPLSGPYAILGRQMAAGVGEAVGETGTVIAFDTECTAEGGEEAARNLQEERVAAVVGFLCTAEIEAALPLLSQAGIPTLTTGVRANRLTERRERTGHLVWRVGPRTEDEADALAAFVLDNWRTVPFGIVDDGSANARDLSDEVRARLDGLSIVPALIDDYRPAEERQFAIARRIAQSGVTRLLILGTRTDVATIARDAAELDLALDIVGGEQLLDEPTEGAALASGVRAVALDPAVAGPADAATREGYFAPSFAAAEIALAALARVGDGAPDMAAALNGTRFETTLGPIEFDANGDGNAPAFEVLVFDGERFLPAPQS